MDTKKDNAYQLFSIQQAAHACNLSRSSLIRLEEKGLITPAYIDTNNRYRYYDNYNITRILQIQKFQLMGFTTEEINSYYTSEGKAGDLLAVLEQKLYRLQQQVEEMRLRSHDVPDMSFSIIKIPETVCCVCCRPINDTITRTSEICTQIGSLVHFGANASF